MIQGHGRPNRIESDNRSPVGHRRHVRPHRPIRAVCVVACRWVANVLDWIGHLWLIDSRHILPDLQILGPRLNILSSSTRGPVRMSDRRSDFAMCWPQIIRTPSTIMKISATDRTIGRGYRRGSEMLFGYPAIWGTAAEIKHYASVGAAPF